MKKKVAVVILNWNGAALLQRFLPSVCAHTPAHLADIVVADNGSTDNSVELLTRTALSQSVLLLPFPRNYGFAEGYNRALDELDYEYAVLLNSDVEVTAHWLEPLLEFVESHPDVAACQPKIRSLTRTREIRICRSRRRIHRPLRLSLLPRAPLRDPRDRLRAVRRPARHLLGQRCRPLRAHRRLPRGGGLDPGFFAHMEEIDLCWRIHLAGYRIAVVPQSRVHHQGGASLDAANPQKTYLNFRNNLLMLTRTCPDRRGKRCCSSAGSTTRWLSPGSLPWDRYLMPAPF